MISFKGCLRCSGDLVSEKDSFGSYEICLQCGNVIYPDSDSPGIKKLEAVEIGADGSPPHKTRNNSYFMNWYSTMAATIYQR